MVLVLIQEVLQAFVDFTVAGVKLLSQCAPNKILQEREVRKLQLGAAAELQQAALPVVDRTTAQYFYNAILARLHFAITKHGKG